MQNLSEKVSILTKDSVSCSVHEQDLVLQQWGYSCAVKGCNPIWTFKYNMEPTYTTSFRIRTIPRIKLDLSMPPLRTEKNNITEFAIHRKGNIFSLNIPQEIETKFGCLDYSSSKMVQDIIDAEEYLPLEIKESSIKNAGSGMFATENIPKGTLVNVYTGDIGPHFDIRQSDSIFQLGVIRRKFPDGARPMLGTANLLLDGRNSARYINSAQGGKANCLMKQYMFVNQSNKNDIVLVLSTKKKINVGDELFYDYGSMYEMKKMDYEPITKSRIQENPISEWK